MQMRVKTPSSPPRPRGPGPGPARHTAPRCLHLHACALWSLRRQSVTGSRVSQEGEIAAQINVYVHPENWLDEQFASAAPGEPAQVAAAPGPLGEGLSAAVAGEPDAVADTQAIMQSVLNPVTQQDEDDGVAPMTCTSSWAACC